MRLLVWMSATVMITGAATATEMFKAKSWEMKGQFSFERKQGERYENSEGDHVTEIRLAAGPAYFVCDYLSLGPILRFSEYYQGDSDQGNLDIGPLLTWYFLSTEGGALYAETGYTVGDRTRKMDETRQDFSLGVGHLFALNSHVGIAASVLHHWRSQEFPSYYYHSGVRHGTEIEFALGFRFFAGRKGAGA